MTAIYAIPLHTKCYAGESMNYYINEGISLKDMDHCLTKHPTVKNEVYRGHLISRWTVGKEKYVGAYAFDLRTNDTHRIDKPCSLKTLKAAKELIDKKMKTKPFEVTFENKEFCIPVKATVIIFKDKQGKVQKVEPVTWAISNEETEADEIGDVLGDRAYKLATTQ